MNPKLSSTVSVVKINDSILEFFKTNTREQVRIKVQNDCIMKIVNSLDGTKDLKSVSEEFNVDKNQLSNLISFLGSKGILSHLEPQNDFYNYEKHRRVINFLNDYSKSHESLLKLWANITNSTVLIIGLGAVGSWIAINLAQSGVQNFILIDNDKVELSNLHRQAGFFESDIGFYKTDMMEKRIKEFCKNADVIKINALLNESILNQLDDRKIDLVINCADQPNVDTTSLWVGEYCMKRKIPHIVGGGYNQHLSLIGQTVIPNKTACVKCFQTQLEQQNKIDTNRVKKLNIKNRKVGSLGPMCSIIASMIEMEAIKVLSKCCLPSNINRRGEFDIYTMNIKYKNYKKLDDCEWCGMNGIYTDKKCL